MATIKYAVIEFWHPVYVKSHQTRVTIRYTADTIQEAEAWRHKNILKQGLDPDNVSVVQYSDKTDETEGKILTSRTKGNKHSPQTSTRPENKFKS